MEKADWPSIITAYNNGLTADMLQAEFDGKWGVIWTIPSCDPEALERAGRQFLRSRAQSVRHIRRAVLHRRDQQGQAIVVATELPFRRQQVRDLETAEEVVLRQFLIDESLTALETVFVPSAAEAV